MADKLVFYPAVADTEADSESVLADSKGYNSHHHPLEDEHGPPIRLRYWLVSHCRYPYLERDLSELESETTMQL